MIIFGDKHRIRIKALWVIWGNKKFTRMVKCFQLSFRISLVLKGMRSLSSTWYVSSWVKNESLVECNRQNTLWISLPSVIRSSIAWPSEHDRWTILYIHYPIILLWNHSNIWPRRNKRTNSYFVFSSYMLTIISSTLSHYIWNYTIHMSWNSSKYMIYHTLSSSIIFSIISGSVLLL